MYVVYWLHNEGMTDPLSQGYIGITFQLEKRLKKHSLNPTNPLVRNKWDRLTYEVLFQGLTEDEALKIEGRYRPTKNLGWNASVGGIKTPDRSGVKLTDEHRGKLSKALKGKSKYWLGKKLSNETKEKMRKAHTGRKHSTETLKKMCDIQKLNAQKTTRKRNEKGQYK